MLQPRTFSPIKKAAMLQPRTFSPIKKAAMHK